MTIGLKTSYASAGHKLNNSPHFPLVRSSPAPNERARLRSPFQSFSRYSTGYCKRYRISGPIFLHTLSCTWFETCTRPSKSCGLPPGSGPHQNAQPNGNSALTASFRNIFTLSSEYRHQHLLKRTSADAPYEQFDRPNCRAREASKYVVARLGLKTTYIAPLVSSTEIVSDCSWTESVLLTFPFKSRRVRTSGSSFVPRTSASSPGPPQGIFPVLSTWRP